MPTTTNRFAKVKRAPLVNCLTCTLCLNLLREATTISVCLHTFCKDCIYQKLEEDESCTCPICNVYLGCSPCDKLRPDNSLQELRMKIFPLNKLKEPETSANVAAATTRRKERSLSSLVTSSSPVPKRRCLSRTRSSSRKAFMSQPNKLQLESDKDIVNGSTNIEKGPSPGRPNALSVGNKKQRITCGKEPSQPHISQEEVLTKVDQGTNWEALEFLAEAADKTDNSKTALLGLPAVKKEIYEKLTAKNKRRLRRRARESSSPEQMDKHDEGNSLHKLDSNGDVEGQSLEEQRALEISSGDGSSDTPFRKLRPVWFSLRAAKNQNGYALPQIPQSHIRVMDGTMPSSYVNKYLARKLKLSESEVEVTCCSQTLVPTAPLNSIGDIWVRHMVRKGKGKGFAPPHPKLDLPSPDNIQNFVVVLTYCRRKRSPPAP